VHHGVEDVIDASSKACAPVQREDVHDMVAKVAKWGNALLDRCGPQQVEDRTRTRAFPQNKVR
jgi:hypothetical protein